MNTQTDFTPSPFRGMTDEEVAQKLLYTLVLAMRHAHEETVMRTAAFGMPDEQPSVSMLDPKKLETMSKYLGVPAGDKTLSLARQANAIVRSYHHSEWNDRLLRLAENMGLTYRDFTLNENKTKAQ